MTTGARREWPPTRGSPYQRRSQAGADGRAAGARAGLQALPHQRLQAGLARIDDSVTAGHMTTLGYPAIGAEARG